MVQRRCNVQRALAIGIDGDSLIVSSIAVDVVDDFGSLIMSKRNEQFLLDLSPGSTGVQHMLTARLV